MTFTDVHTDHQKLDVILGTKVVQFWSYQKMYFTKNVVLDWYSSMKKKWEIAITKTYKQITRSFLTLMELTTVKSLLRPFAFYLISKNIIYIQNTKKGKYYAYLLKNPNSGFNFNIEPNSKWKNWKRRTHLKHARSFGTKTMAIRGVEFSNKGYKIIKIFA